VVEEARAVQDVELAAQAVVQHPELAVVAEPAAEFLHPVRRPFLRAVAPEPVPFADAVPGSPTPGFLKWCELRCAGNLGSGCRGMLGCLPDQHQPNHVALFILLFHGSGVCVIEGEISQGEISSSFRIGSKRR